MGHLGHLPTLKISKLCVAILRFAEMSEKKMKFYILIF